MDEKFYYLSQGLVCSRCKSDKVRAIGNSKYGGHIVKCDNCGEIFLEEELDEKEEDGYIVPETTI